jgi:uncharacterized protein (DUF302 family)
VESFALKKVLGATFDDVLARLPAALAAEGFGILTEIDVKDTLARKLNADFRRYRILGACNPGLAHRALQAELDVGVMLPCSVAVYETDEGGAAVAAIDPTSSPAALANPAVREVARTVREKLARVLDHLA